MSQLVTELFSSTWFMSVFVVGVLINLASAYLKPPIDRLLSRSSERIRARSEAMAAELETQSSAIASDTTLLIIEGQRLHTAELHTLTGFVMFLVVLTFGIFAQASGISPEKKAYLEIAVYVLLAFLMILTLAFMSRETKQNSLVHMARKKLASRI